MPSASAKGSYYKTRTKTWLERRGYDVAFMERLMWVRGGNQPCPACRQVKMFASKRDQLGADLLATNVDEIVMVQVKLNRNDAAKAAREYARFRFPASVKLWIVIWTPRAREPEVVDARAYLAGLTAHTKTARQQATQELF